MKTQADSLNVPNPTAEPRSRSRQEGLLWSERLLARVRSASKDAARFEAGLLEVE